MKTTVAIFIFFIIAVAVFPFLHLENDNHSKGGVVTSNFALYDISKALLQEDVNISMLIPVGVDLHTFEPTPKDVIRIKRSDFFIYSGANIEHYLKNFHDKNSIDMSQTITLLSHNDASHQHHSDSEYDPHYWLDIDNMIKMTQTLQDIYAKKYVQLVPDITQRAQTYIQNLEALKKLYQIKLAQCNIDEIIVNHNAYGYLAHQYNFHVNALSGLSSDAQVNAKDMLHVVDEIKTKKIPTLFYDAFESAKELETLSSELHVKLETLNTLANITPKQFKQNANYNSLMRENLTKLSEAMMCQ